MSRKPTSPVSTMRFTKGIPFFNWIGNWSARSQTRSHPNVATRRRSPWIWGAEPVERCCRSSNAGGEPSESISVTRCSPALSRNMRNSARNNPPRWSWCTATWRSSISCGIVRCTWRPACTARSAWSKAARIAVESSNRSHEHCGLKDDSSSMCTTEEYGLAIRAGCCAWFAIACAACRTRSGSTAIACTPTEAYPACTCTSTARESCAAICSVLGCASNASCL